jgi:hypothetical protein
LRGGLVPPPEIDATTPEPETHSEGSGTGGETTQPPAADAQAQGLREERPAQTRRSRRKRHRRLLAGLALGTAVLVALLALPERTTRTVRTDLGADPAGETPATTPTTAWPTDPSPFLYTWVPRSVTIDQPLRLPPWLLVVLGVGAWLGAFGLYLLYRRRKRLPPPDPEPGAGPAWVPLVDTGEAGGRFVDAEARRLLIWNVGRFESEETTRRIDLPATTAATARAAGVIQIRHERAVYPREIWLWEDELCPDPALPALAGELAQGLGRAGLALRRGGFPEVPHQVCWGQGDCIEPLMIEGHQRTAMVAILTDGEGLALALGSGQDRQRTVALLNGLRHWPHLTLVDFSGQGRVHALARDHGLCAIGPDALPAWLGGEDIEGGPGVAPMPRLGGETRVWAAACCLGDQPLDHRDALDLHARLGLGCPTWAYRDLVADAGNDRLLWPPERRHAHINWLIASTGLPTDDLPPADNRLARAVAWWRERYGRDGARREGHEAALTPWRRTPAARRRALEQALLGLYTAPDPTAPELYRLAGPGLEEEIRDRLARLAARDQRPPGDTNGEAAIYLPWRLATRPPQTQRLLIGLGFGGSAIAPVLPRGALRDISA